jgi:two-component system response regulator (stage 0 sporulation protein F)
MPCKPILIVEDHQSIRTSLQEFFADEGYPVLLTCQGQEALDLLAQATTPRPGLILVDYRMPVMDGPSFLIALQNAFPDIFAQTPIFVMSAGTEKSKLMTHTTGFLLKPFDLDELSRIATLYCGQESIAT